MTEEAPAEQTPLNEDAPPADPTDAPSAGAESETSDSSDTSASDAPTSEPSGAETEVPTGEAVAANEGGEQPQDAESATTDPSTSSETTPDSGETGAEEPGNPTTAGDASSDTDTASTTVSADTESPADASTQETHKRMPLDGEGGVDAAEAHERAVNVALSTNAIPPPPTPPALEDQDAVAPGDSHWVCVNDKTGARTVAGGVICPVIVVKLSELKLGERIVCPNCGGTSVRRATESEASEARTAIS